jgi:hypothetical protein
MSSPTAHLYDKARRRKLSDYRMSAKIFVTYSQPDMDFVRRLCTDLASIGLEIWRGERSAEEIDRGLTWSEVYIPVISRASLGSRACIAEMNAALIQSSRRATTKTPLRIIPVLAEDCADKLPAPLASRLRFNLAGRYGKGLLELVENSFGLAAAARLPAASPTSDAVTAAPPPAPPRPAPAAGAPKTAAAPAKAAVASSTSPPPPVAAAASGPDSPLPPSASVAPTPATSDPANAAPPPVPPDVRAAKLQAAMARLMPLLQEVRESTYQIAEATADLATVPEKWRGKIPEEEFNSRMEALAMTSDLLADAAPGWHNITSLLVFARHHQAITMENLDHALESYRITSDEAAWGAETANRVRNTIQQTEALPPDVSQPLLVLLSQFREQVAALRREIARQTL